MSFVVFISGPRVATLAGYAAAIVEECSSRGVATQVIATFNTVAEYLKVVTENKLAAHTQELLNEDIAAFVLCDNVDVVAREQLISATNNAVVVDWCQSDDITYSRSVDPHLSYANETEVLEGLAQTFAVLEGLGYIAFAGQGSLSPEQDAELVDKLKQLGYV